MNYKCIRCESISSESHWNESTVSDFGSNITKLGEESSIVGCIVSCPICGGTNEAIHFIKQGYGKENKHVK